MIGACGGSALTRRLCTPDTLNDTMSYSVLFIEIKMDAEIVPTEEFELRPVRPQPPFVGQAFRKRTCLATSWSPAATRAPNFREVSRCSLDSVLAAVGRFRSGTVLPNWKTEARAPDLAPRTQTPSPSRADGDDCSSSTLADLLEHNLIATPARGRGLRGTRRSPGLLGKRRLDHVWPVPPARVTPLTSLRTDDGRGRA